MGVQFNKFTMVFRGVDPYLPRFTSSHGQNVVDSRGAAELDWWKKASVVYNLSRNLIR